MSKILIPLFLAFFSEKEVSFFSKQFPPSRACFNKGAIVSIDRSIGTSRRISHYRALDVLECTFYAASSGRH